MFHSFEVFSIPQGGTAYFNNSAEVQNIFARVTGRSPSTIDGMLRANGSANLLLLNPNGILFGQNASLNIGGSFLATTASSINFENFQFSAANPQPFPLLTLSVPVGLQFGSRSASVINRSQASPNGRVNVAGRPVGLEVTANQNLTLLSNEILLQTGNLTARGGRIRLGSVAPSSLVSLSPDGMSVRPLYAESQRFGNISMSKVSYVDTSGDRTGRRNGGAIDLRGRAITLEDGSRILSRTYQGRGEDWNILASSTISLMHGSEVLARIEESGRGGRILIQAGDRIALTGPLLSTIGTQATGTTQPGSRTANIVLSARNISLQDGSRIEGSTFGDARGGDVEVRGSSIEIAGFNRQPIDTDGDQNPDLQIGQVTSGIYVQAQGSSDAGNLTINTRRLRILDGGVISVATFAAGNSGRLSIDATESVVVSGASPAVRRDFYRSGIFATAAVSGQNGIVPSGSVGRLAITTPHLTVSDRAEVSASNQGTGSSGNITLRDLDRLVVQDGGEIRASTLGAGPGGTLDIEARSIEVSGSGVIGSEIMPSALAALSIDSGNAGNLNVRADRLTVQDGGEVSVSATGTGLAGDLSIQTSAVQLDRGRLAAETNQGEVSNANIRLSGVDTLVMRNQSRITAQAFQNAAGGNVAIQAPEGVVIAVAEDNDIVATAFRGRGGNITIDARSIIGLEERSSRPAGNGTNDIDASSQFGASGTVTVLQNIDPERGLTELPTDLVDASSLIAQSCSTRGAVARSRSEFVITGRSGLPIAPAAPAGISHVGIGTAGWATLNEADELALSTSAIDALTASPNRFGNEINRSSEWVEAQGWIREQQGEVRLVATLPAMPQVGETAWQCDGKEDAS